MTRTNRESITFSTCADPFLNLCLMFHSVKQMSGAGGRCSDTPALWRDSGDAEWVGLAGPQGWTVLCRRSAQVTLVCPLEARRRPWPTWGLRKVEPGQAGNGAAQMPRNREFLERRPEQWLPTCRCAYLDCIAHIFQGRVGTKGKG